MSAAAAPTSLGPCSPAAARPTCLILHRPCTPSSNSASRAAVGARQEREGGAREPSMGREAAHLGEEPVDALRLVLLPLPHRPPSPRHRAVHLAHEGAEAGGEDGGEGRVEEDLAVVRLVHHERLHHVGLLPDLVLVLVDVLLHRVARHDLVVLRQAHQRRHIRRLFAPTVAHSHYYQAAYDPTLGA
eukprot:528739-Rhodomonas_salina.2